ncbi:MAG: hypothetical protein ABW252_20775 [Polyangiales bacterium]
MPRHLALLALLMLPTSLARAEPEGIAPGVQREPVDTTRLDVARLPPEAAKPARTLYAAGWFAEAQLGARAFVGDVRAVSRAGPRFAIDVGHQPTRWLALLIELDASMHNTRGPTPPANSSYELLGAALGVRLTAPLGAQAALWATGLAGVAWTSADVLRARGFRDADNVRPAYGGDLGFDWHVHARHHALGVISGARAYPSLARDGYALGLHGAVHLRYVF